MKNKLEIVKKNLDKIDSSLIPMMEEYLPFLLKSGEISTLRNLITRHNREKRKTIKDFFTGIGV